MELCEINVESRAELGSASVNKLRREGKVPAVVYGEGLESRSIALGDHEFTLVAKKAHPTSLFRFKSSETALNGQLALVKDVQVEDIKGKLLHVDFLAVSEGHKITVSVPIKLLGESPAVKDGSSILNQSVYELDIYCLPTAIPEAIEVNISGLLAGHSVHARDIVLPEGAELQADEDLNIVSVAHIKEETVAPVETVAAESPAAATAAAASGQEASATPAKPQKGGK